MNAFSTLVYVHETDAERIIQAKLKGLLRPLLDTYYKNDPPDYTQMLRRVEYRVIDIVAQQIRKMPPKSVAALTAYYQQLHDSGRYDNGFDDEDDDEDY